MQNKSNEKEFFKMTPNTRDYFLSNFSNHKGGIVAERAALVFDVSPRTVRHWWRVGCPNWVNRFADMAQRSIPDTEQWHDFRFVNGRLLMPYKNLSFSASDLLMQYYDRQFNAMVRTDNAQLASQVDALRNKEEAAAINQEIDDIIKTLNKLKNSPVLANKKEYHKAVAR